MKKYAGALKHFIKLAGGFEKERKFVVADPAALDELKGIIEKAENSVIHQHNLPVEDSERDKYSSKRIRKRVYPDGTVELTTTAKGWQKPGELGYPEDEKEIDESTYTKLQSQAVDEIIKSRARVEDFNGYPLDIDTFHSSTREPGFTLIEVEHPEAEKFRAPKGWMEVTGDKNFSAGRLARRLI